MSILTSSEKMEQRKKEMIANYSTTFSGYRTKGSHDGYSVITELRKMDESSREVKRGNPKYLSSPKVTLKKANKKGIPMLKTISKQDYIAGDGTHVYL